MRDYQKYINALRKCAKEHDNDTTYTGHIIISDLCRDTANLLEALEQEPKWIPVGERLPNLDDYTGSRVWQKKVLITGYLSFDDTKELFISEAFAKDVIYNRVPNTVIEAWMPLPEPYKVESEEMRNATPEEQKSVDNYIKSISKPTGVNFELWDIKVRVYSRQNQR